MILFSNMKSFREIKKGYDLISTGLLYLDQNRASTVALHGKEALSAIDVANKAAEALRTSLEALKRYPA